MKAAVDNTNAKEFRRGSFSAKTGPIQLPADVRFTPEGDVTSHYREMTKWVRIGSNATMFNLG